MQDPAISATERPRVLPREEGNARLSLKQ
jgi:hypothetical protein